jgi:hypothetical protein
MASEEWLYVFEDSFSLGYSCIDHFREIEGKSEFWWMSDNDGFQFQLDCNANQILVIL